MQNPSITDKKSVIECTASGSFPGSDGSFPGSVGCNGSADSERPLEPQASKVLKVRSSGPNVNIKVVPKDKLGQGNAETPFNRVYDMGTCVHLIAPKQICGYLFCKWLLNGDFLVSIPNIIIDIPYGSSERELTAVYAPYNSRCKK